MPQGTMGWTGEVIGALVLILIAATPLFALDVAELTGATQPLSHPPRPRIDDYAGGPGRGAASLLFRNRDDDFPAWAGRDLPARDPSAHLDLLASDGATSTTVLTSSLGSSTAWN